MPELWIDLADLENPSDPYAEYAAWAATNILWKLSGRKFHGVSTITETYVCPSYDIPPNCSWIASGVFRTPYGWNGYITNDLVNHQQLHTRFRLRQQPVRRILSVNVGGSAIPSGYYKVRNRSEIVVTAGDGCGFTLCDAPEITYMYGTPPPSEGTLAAIDLANQLVRGYNGQACDLPDNVVNIQRQGLSIEMFNPANFLENGRIGLYSADLFISANNPAKANLPAKIFSPEKPKGFTRR